MTLKDKFDNPIMRHDLMRNEIEETKEQCVEIADEFAIGFADWCKEEYDVESTPFHNKWLSVDGEYISTKELLEIYKKEKGL